MYIPDMGHVLYVVPNNIAPMYSGPSIVQAFI